MLENTTNFDENKLQIFMEFALITLAQYCMLILLLTLINHFNIVIHCFFQFLEMVLGHTLTGL